jgi:hypothetical protein
MSAVRSLTEVGPTWRGRPNSVEITQPKNVGTNLGLAGSLLVVPALWES